VIDDSCGITVPAIHPEQLANDLAGAISRLARDASLRARLSGGARERIERIGLWENKISWLLALYDELLDTNVQSELLEVS
jgi:hypothetical protein